MDDPPPGGLGRHGMIWRALLLAANLAGFPGIGSSAGWAADRCAADDGVSGTPAALSHAAKQVIPGGTLDVLVVGSATVFGPEASLQAGTITSQALGVPNATPSPIAPSPNAFPNVMGRAIEAAVPGATVHVTIRGARSMTATAMLELLHAELEQHHYALVIWQTGTVEAVRNIQSGDFAQTLADGEQIVHDANADLVLVDPQYSRFLQTNANLDPYFLAFQQAATVPDVVWFRRWDLMRGWVADNQIDLERTPRGDRKSTVAALHDCLGQHLARLVLASTRS